MRNDSVFSLVVGSSMMLMWVFFLSTGMVPELEYKPVETWFSIAADNLTAVLLLVGGFGLLRERAWGRDVFLLSMGALFYSLMIAIGYYAQLGEVSMLGMFVPIFLLMLYFTWGKLRG